MAAPRPIPHHGRNKTCDLLDVAGVVRQARNEHKPDPDGFPQRIQPLGKPQSRLEILTRRLVKGVRVTALDIQQYKIDVGEVIVVCPMAKKPRGIECRMQAQPLGCCEQSTRETHLHERLATRNGKTTAHCAQCRCEVAEAPDGMRQFDPDAILQMPCIRVMAIETAQQATGHEDHDPHAGTVHSGSRFVGVHPAEGRFLAFEGAGLRSIGRSAGAEVEPAADLHHPMLRHALLTLVSSCDGRYGG